MKILYIKANPKNDSDSNTFTLSNNFIIEYKKNNPTHEIIELDLYKNEIKPLDSNMLYDLFNKENNLMKDYAIQFSTCDKYVIAAPMWNLSIPSILKSYIDYIVQREITFKYTNEGPIGLLKNKKVLYISSRGGIYSSEPYSNFEMGERYLKTILGFLGIDNFNSIILEGTNLLTNTDLQTSKELANKKIIEMAKLF